jgi:hypothetical protein
MNLLCLIVRTATNRQRLLFGHVFVSMANSVIHESFRLAVLRVSQILERLVVMGELRPDAQFRELPEFVLTLSSQRITFRSSSCTWI